jgi:hypothetical protein
MMGTIVKSGGRVSKELKGDLSRLLDYLWQDEQKHYTGGPSKDHIYLVMRRLAKRIRYEQR